VFDGEHHSVPDDDEAPVAGAAYAGGACVGGDVERARVVVKVKRSGL
jgi:hypothetical protein